ncbi:hypothetical protein ZWY2020_020838 [Hordeum vulgare]|nr:hypothetical protein ZWY2020_020838 [Hordeum vulgare]
MVTSTAPPARKMPDSASSISTYSLGWMSLLHRKGLMERDQLPVGMQVLSDDDDPVCLKLLKVLLDAASIMVRACLQFIVYILIRNFILL